MKNLIYRQTDFYDVIKIENDILLVPFNDCNYKKAILLNETSAKIFGYIQEKKSVLEIVDLLFEEYDVERNDVEEDIKKCIEHLLSLNAIQEYAK